MRTIHRTIATALIYSRDNKILMGKKDPAKGGVYSDCWHIPGGGVDEGETLTDALVREVREETGLDVGQYQLEELDYKNDGVSEKTLRDTGERVLCQMTFHYFRIVIDDKDSSDIKLDPTDDLVEMRWFTSGEVQNLKRVPGGPELEYFPEE